MAKMVGSRAELGLLVCDVMMSRMPEPELAGTLRAKQARLEVVCVAEEVLGSSSTWVELGLSLLVRANGLSR